MTWQNLFGDDEEERPEENRALPCTPQDVERQTVLFSGMDCLPGQQDLFEVDGQE